MKIKSKDLTKEAPRSPKVRIGGFVIIARAIDKCRAVIAGKNGEYNFDCSLDQDLFNFKGVRGADFRKVVETGATDEELAKWLTENGTPKTSAEIQKWSDTMETENYATDKEGKEWLEAKNKGLGLKLDGTLFDFLEADDSVSFSNVCGI